MDILSDGSNGLDSSFMYSQLIKETLLAIEYDGDKAKTQFTNYCRDVQSCTGNGNISDVVNEFEHDYNKYSAIRWYARDCFIYDMLN